MADHVSTGRVFDPITGLYSYFIVTYDDVTFNASNVHVINNTSRTAIVRLFPPNNAPMQSYTFPPGTDISQNLPQNGRYNMETWGYSYGFL